MNLNAIELEYLAGLLERDPRLQPYNYIDRAAKALRICALYFLAIENAQQEKQTTETDMPHVNV